MTQEPDSRSHISRPGEQQSIELPPMQDALLDEETLAALVRDLNECAEITEVLIKGDALVTPDRQNLRLDDAVLRLMNEEVRGVQVRYTFDGESWCDTLMRTPQGIRLVRVQPQL